MELSNELNQKIKRDNVSFRTVSLITIDIELKTHIKVKQYHEQMISNEPFQFLNNCWITILKKILKKN